MKGVELFAGPGGWSTAARDLGIVSVGVESHPDVARTRRANAHPTVERSVLDVGPLDPTFDGELLIASPPCQTFSRAGKGAGRQALNDVLVGLDRIWHYEELPEFDDVRTRLVLEPFRWIVERHRVNRPYRRIAMEQVPSVLPVWQAYTNYLRGMGYAAQTAVLSAEEYGVPQTRKRAILVASFDHDEFTDLMPRPTHGKYKFGQPAVDSVRYGLDPWVSMADALAEVMPDDLVGFPRAADNDDVIFLDGKAYRARDFREGRQPAFAVTSKVRSWIHLPVNNQSGTAFDLDWQIAQPAQVVAGRPLVPFRGANANRFNGATKSRNDGFKVTIEQMARLQTFPADYQWQGTRTSVAQQIGDAIPVVLATAILRTLV